jgi:hypothetical protein
VEEVVDEALDKVPAAVAFVDRRARSSEAIVQTLESEN